MIFKIYVKSRFPPFESSINYEGDINKHKKNGFCSEKAALKALNKSEERSKILDYFIKRAK